MKRKHHKPDPPGVSFERIVAAIQSQLDPAATVVHNEVLIDRLGQSRQFDVVVRGSFAAQPMLGVIECKDLSGRVGTPEVDAFVTKSQDVNANFKLLVSRRGFSKPALRKCKHYGIQPISLIEKNPSERKFFVGTRWEADVFRWSHIAISLHFLREPPEPVHFAANEVEIDGKKVMDWFTNYLLDHHASTSELGWVVDIGVEFSRPQAVTIGEGRIFECGALGFKAERVCDQYELLVGISGTGFFNWNNAQVTVPGNTQITTDAVPLDFSQWRPRSATSPMTNGFLSVKLEAIGKQFNRVVDAIDLDTL